MITLFFLASMSLGLSESIEARLPADPDMIYTVGFKYDGIKVGLDWKNRAVVPSRVCRKTSIDERPACQLAALDWLRAECAYYDDQKKGFKRLSRAQKDMQKAVCEGATDLAELLKAQKIARR